MFDRDKWELENQDLLKSWYDRGRGATRKIICGGCGRIFYTQSEKKMYCRPYRCGNIANNRRQKEKRIQARSNLTCEYCGGIYNAKRKDSRYCCNACRQKAYRNRVKTVVEGTE